MLEDVEVGAKEVILLLLKEVIEEVVSGSWIANAVRDAPTSTSASIPWEVKPPSNMHGFFTESVTKTFLVDSVNSCWRGEGHV
mgnify:CR=1 FL=1